MINELLNSIRNYYNSAFFTVYMNDTTSISDLPSNPNGPTNNMTIADNKTMSLDQTTINQIVNGLQQASVSGATLLPSRDIPANTTHISTDQQIQPNYIPAPEKHVDYIKNYENPADMIDEYARTAKQRDSLDEMYAEFQTPFLLAVLYFMFQLPFFRKYLYKYFPILFAADGNMNINGFLFSSVLFGLLFYAINKTTSQFSRF
jgi:hypothetical protein